MDSATLTRTSTASLPPPNAARAKVAAVFPRPLVALLVIMFAAPWWLPKVGLYPYLAVEIAIWMLYAQGYNLLLGHSGLPSFGHGAFFGIGAYAFGLAQKHVALNLWLDLAGGVLAAALAGALVVAFISHRRGIYYALLTIAFGQVAWFVAIKWHSITGGEDGLLNLRRPPLDFGVAELSLTSNEALFTFVSPGWSSSYSVAGGSSIRRRAVCSHAFGRTKCARGSSAIGSGGSSSAYSCCRRRLPASPVRCSPWRSSRRTRT